MPECRWEEARVIVRAKRGARSHISADPKVKLMPVFPLDPFSES